MTTVEDYGFIADEVDSMSHEFIRNNEDVVALFRESIAFAHEIRKSVKVNSSDRVAIYLASLFIRTLEHSEAVYVTSIRGLGIEAKIILRALLEAVFSFRAVAAQANVLPDLVAQSDRRHLEIMQRHRAARPKVEGNQEFMARLAELEEMKRRGELKKSISVKDLAEQAAMRETYDLVYSWFCADVHVGTRSLMEHLEIKDGCLVSIRFGPNFEWSRDAILSAIHAVLLLLGSGGRVLPSLDDSRLRGMMDRWEKLGCSAGQRARKV